MALESPLGKPALMCPLAACINCGIRIVPEEPHEHVHESEIPQGFAAGPEFDIVIRRSCRRTQQAIRKHPHELGNGGLPHAVEVLENTRFVANHPSEIPRREAVNSFVVRDDNTRVTGDMPIYNSHTVNAELLRLA